MNNFQLYQLLNLVANKDVYSNWLKPEEFDLALKSGNVRLMRDRLGLPERYRPGTFQAGGSGSRVLETDLTPFLVIGTDLGPVEQVVTLTRWYYINDFYTKDSLEPEIISQQELGSRINHPILIANDRYPWAIIVKKGLKVYPKSLTKVTVSYYRYPVDPAFVTTVDDEGNLVYDEDASVELEWRDENKIDILHLIMQAAGINIERPDLEAYAQKLVEGGK